MKEKRVQQEDQECSNVTVRKCYDFPKRKCQNIERRVPRNVPRRQCQEIRGASTGKKICRTTYKEVPNLKCVRVSKMTL